ncbi:MAG TPA: glycosyltransferase family 4 protein [Solirubrobacteraceae bacterium]
MSESRALYVSSYAPIMGSGRALRTYTCVRALAMLGPVDLAYVAHGGAGPSAEYRAIENLTFHEITSSRGLRRGLLYVSKRLRGVPAICSRGTSPELAATAEALAAAPGRSQVIVGDMAAATALLRWAESSPLVYNAHNIESEYVDGHFGQRALSRLAMRRYERRLLAVSAESWMVSRADMRSAQALVPQARLRYVPNVVDVSAIKPGDLAPQPPGVPGSKLLMVGDFEYGPNLTGLKFFVGSVLPLVWRALPQVTLTLVGRGLKGWSSPDPRVRAAGFVPALDPYYQDADCVVVPLTEGAGTPLKFVEALAYRMPVVATPLAAKGLDVVAGVHYREGEDAVSFAEGVIGILRDGAGELAMEGRRLAEREYSIAALAALLAP